MKTICVVCITNIRLPGLFYEKDEEEREAPRKQCLRKNMTAQ